jgi:hypothetical protein
MKKLSVILAMLFILSFPFAANAQITKDRYYTLEGNGLEFYDYNIQRYVVAGEETEEPTPTIELTATPTIVVAEPVATTQAPAAENTPGSPNWSGWLVIAVAVIVGMRVLQVIVSKRKKK